MEIKTFDTSFLNEAKRVLKDVFFNENSDEFFNEWEFAENVLKTNGYLPELCLIALEDEKVAGSAVGQNRAIKDRNSNVIRLIFNCERRDIDGLGKDH